MKAVPNWRSAWRFLSIQITAVGVALQAAVLIWPEVKNWIGDTASHTVGLLILVGAMLGRLKDQTPKEKHDE